MEPTALSHAFKSSDITLSAILSSIIFSGIGLWVFREGKRILNYPVLFVGIALMIFSYFTHGPLADWGVGIALCGLARYFWYL